MLDKVDKEVQSDIMLDEIIHHQKDDTAIYKGQEIFTTASCLIHKKRTTRGWELYKQRKYGITNWVALKYFKESHPIDLTQYAVVSNI